jgi:hypothetical protein
MSRESIRSAKTSPLYTRFGIGIALGVLLITLVVGGLYFVGAIICCVAGILAAATYFICARTGKSHLEFLPGLIIGLSAADVRGSLLVGFPQSAAIGYLTMAAVIHLVSSAFPKLASRSGS